VESKPGGFDKLIDQSVRASALLGGAVLFALMLLTVYSVVMRYLFNAPPYFTLDVSKMALVPVVYLGLAYCGWTGGHIAVDLVGALGRPALTRWTDAGVRLLCALLMGLYAWQLVKLAQDSLDFEEATTLLEIPHFPFILFMAFGAALYCVVLLFLMARSIRGRDDPPRA